MHGKIIIIIKYYNNHYSKRSAYNLEAVRTTNNTNLTNVSPLIRYIRAASRSHSSTCMIRDIRAIRGKKKSRRATGTRRLWYGRDSL